MVSWSFGNEIAWSTVSFGIDNSSSSHTDNCKNNGLVLSEEHSDDINGSIDAAEKNLVLILVKKRKKLLEHALKW